MMETETIDTSTRLVPPTCTAAAMVSMDRLPSRTTHAAPSRTCSFLQQYMPSAARHNTRWQHVALATNTTTGHVDALPLHKVRCDLLKTVHVCNGGDKVSRLVQQCRVHCGTDVGGVDQSRFLHTTSPVKDTCTSSVTYNCKSSCTPDSSVYTTGAQGR